MIRATMAATGTVDGKPLLILGLEAGNLRRLQAGEPMHVAAGSMGNEVDVSVLIIYGETQAQLLDQLRPMIGPQTEAHFAPRGGTSGAG